MYNLHVSADTLEDLKTRIEWLATLDMQELETFLICKNVSGTYEFAYDMFTVNYCGRFKNFEHFALKWLCDNYDMKKDFDSLEEVIQYLEPHTSCYQLENGDVAIFELHP